jgi:hypothetical protein
MPAKSKSAPSGGPWSPARSRGRELWKYNIWLNLLKRHLHWQPYLDLVGRAANDVSHDSHAFV